MFLGSRQEIPTPEINQSVQGGLGHCSSLISLSLQLVVTRYNLLVCPLQLVLILSHQIMQENNPTPIEHLVPSKLGYGEMSER